MRRQASRDKENGESWGLHSFISRDSARDKVDDDLRNNVQQHQVATNQAILNFLRQWGQLQQQRRRRRLQRRIVWIDLVHPQRYTINWFGAPETGSKLFTLTPPQS